MKTKVDHIISDLESKIKAKHLAIGELIPSLSTVQSKYKVSRDTANRAYRELLQRGVINSVKGKGYFVASSEKTYTNVFLLLDELSEYKNRLVKSVEQHLGQYAELKLYFHHYNEEVFKEVIEGNLGKFTHYVVSPIPDSAIARTVLKMIPDHQLTLVDRHDTHDKSYPFVGQEFEKDILNGLMELQISIGQYSQFTFIFPEPSFHPQELKKGFVEFCKNIGIQHHISSSLTDRKFIKQELLLVIDDEDLANAVVKSQQEGLTIGKDLGIISYNETCLKSVVANGITTLSADFEKMGELLAHKLRQSDYKEKIHIPAQVIKRNSL